MDGSGYPRGLAGDEIPLQGRIVATADVFDALTSDRVYRPAMSVSDALEVITSGADGPHDPVVVACLERELELTRIAHT
jgi:HD-GYP domain-containing protein (c-di-GMP phosphodiesterase class II)